MSTLKILLIQHDDVKCFDKLKTRQDKTPGNVEGGGGIITLYIVTCEFLPVILQRNLQQSRKYFQSH